MSFYIQSLVLAVICLVCVHRLGCQTISWREISCSILDSFLWDSISSGNLAPYSLIALLYWSSHFRFCAQENVVGCYFLFELSVPCCKLAIPQGKKTHQMQGSPLSLPLRVCVCSCQSQLPDGSLVLSSASFLCIYLDFIDFFVALVWHKLFH
jgi:hypothetical protein